MKKLKNKQHQVKKSKQQNRKNFNYNNSSILEDTNTITPKLIQTSQFLPRNIAKREAEQKQIETRRKNAELRASWLENYNLKLSSLHEQIFDFIKENNDIGAISIEYIFTDCKDYLPAGTPSITSRQESHLEFYMGVRNNVIVDVSLNFDTLLSFQEGLKDVQDERIDYLVDFDLDETDGLISRLDKRIAYYERVIDLIQKCNYSTHRVIDVPGTEAVLAPLENLENSIFDEHDQNWICNFDADHICVDNLEKCLDLCNYIDEDADKALLKKVCLHTGYGNVICSSIKWNPVRAEEFRSNYKQHLGEDGSLCIAP